LRTGAPGHQEHVVPTYPGYQSDDLDARVRDAVIRSEAVIKRSSPTKYANSKLDPYIQRYLRNDLAKDQSLLVAISPHLTSESKYTTTLTIEQPNYGRESQPLNFGQDVPESVKKSSYVEAVPATHHSQTHGQTAYGQPGVSSSQYYGTTTGGVAADYGQVATKLSQAYGTGHLASSGLGHQTYGVPAGNLAHSGLGHQTYGVPTGNLAHSGLGQNYPATNLTGLGQQTYNVTSIHHSSSHTPTHGGVVAQKGILVIGK